MELMAILHPLVQAGIDRYGLVCRVLECDPQFADTVVFCEKYGFTTGQSANAIICASKKEPVDYVCCLVLGDCKLDVNKKVSRLMQVKRVSFATSEQTSDLTNMEIGGVTPVGLPDNIPIYIDGRVMEVAEVVIGGGNRSSKLIMAPAELLKLPGAQVIADLAFLK